jgi:DNA-directed RNA polymerase specialized sigma24 family protein
LRGIEAYQALQIAQCKLTREQRKILRMRDHDKSSWETISDLLGIGSPEAARKRYERARKEMQNRFIEICH